MTKCNNCGIEELIHYPKTDVWSVDMNCKQFIPSLNHSSDVKSIENSECHQDKDPEGIARLSPAVNSGSDFRGEFK